MVAGDIPEGTYHILKYITVYHHNMMAIFEGRRTGKLHQLRTLILTSAFYIMRNYEENINLLKLFFLINDDKKISYHTPRKK
jgi:hypothetical protein